MSDKNVILKVENLCQFFKLGSSTLRAVNDISFEIKKGEVFGLVGESGCGKTTTGRAIIKLYDATSGSVYLKGQRICAGYGAQKEAIKKAKKDTASAIAEFRLKAKENPSEAALYTEKETAKKAELAAFIAEQKEKISRAKYDHKYSDRGYSRHRKGQVNEEFLPKLEEAERLLSGTTKGTPEYEKHLSDYQALKMRYNDEMRVASREKLITQIQMIFQDPISSLNPRMTVRDLIAEGLIVKGMRDQDEIDRRVYEVMDLVGLMPEHAGRYQHEFSGGQRQRIGIARAIILQPELLIADEPVSALDVSIQAQVITLLNELREKIGLTILFIAHNLSVVKYFSDRIAVMYYGKIMEVATSAELFERPMHPYTKALLSAVPYPDPLHEQQRKRIIYNPIAQHDYTVDKPTLTEVVPGHVVYCNKAELEALKKEYSL